MAKRNLEEKDVCIKWYMKDDKIIKFKEIDETFNVADNVAKFNFEKQGIGDGSEVTVKIDPSEGDHGTVVFMTKRGTGTKKTESKTQDTSSEKQVMTVKGISFKTKSLIFAEEENTWYTLGDHISVNDLKKYGVVKDVKVEISTSDPEKEGGNRIIKFIKKVDGSEPKKETNKKPTEESNNSYNKDDFYKIKRLENKIEYLENAKQDSFEAQAAVSNAVLAVSRLFAGQLDPNNSKDADVFKSAVNSVAQNNWDLIKKLQDKS